MLLNATHLHGVWDKINKEWLDILKIHTTESSGSGNYEMTAQEQFEDYYYGRIMKITDKERAKRTFIRLFVDNKIMVYQIDFYQRQIKELIDKNTWVPSESSKLTNSGSTENNEDTTNTGMTNTKTDSKDESTSNAINKTSSFTLNNTGSSIDNVRNDEASRYTDPANITEMATPTIQNGNSTSQLKVGESLDLEIDIDAHAYTQAKTFDTNASVSDANNSANNNSSANTNSSSEVKTTKVGTYTNTIDNVKTSKNDAATYDAMVRIQLPELRRNFWNVFSEMFL